MNCDYKIKIDYDYDSESDSESEFGDSDRREFLFRGISFDISCISCHKDIREIMNQFEYIKKVNNVNRTISEREIMNQFEYIKKVNNVNRTIGRGGYFFFEALCNKNLTLQELKEFVKKLKRDGFSSKSNVNIVFIKTENNTENKTENKYIHKISFETCKNVEIRKHIHMHKYESTYSSHVIYEDKSESKVEETKAKINPNIQKCNSCGGIGVGLVSENGFCEHCNRTKKLYSCSLCNRKFSTNSGKDKHFKMKHEKQSQFSQVEEALQAHLSIPDIENPMYHIDTSGLCQPGSVEPLTKYLITLFVVNYWRIKTWLVIEFDMVSIIQKLCLKYIGSCQ
jgi:DNA polymerase III alpha subunit (gram-positive type)